MKLLFTLFFFVSSIFSFSQTETTKVEGFLESIVTQFPNVRDIALTSDQSEVVFTAQSFMGEISALITTKKINNEWSKPEIISFSGQYFDLEPYFSDDRLTLYFVSNRPLDKTSTKTKDFDIWYVNRKTVKDKWSPPVNMGSPINTEMDEFYPVITDSKNIYFTLDNPSLNQKDNIYVSKFINGNYTKPEPLSPAINSEGYEFNAFVSKDESYIIFTCYNRDGGFGSGDLYMSYKSENGDWTPAKNMGNVINTDKMDYCPFVDEISNTLYFTSKRNTVKGVSEKKSSTKELFDTFYIYENGLSRLYRINLKKN